MIELITIIQDIIERGLLFGIVVIAVYLSSKLIHFDNLAIEGAFGLGGALCALAITWGMNPWLALILATGIGAFSGIITGLLHTKLNLNNLISGIVITTGLFSISLKCAGANTILPHMATIFAPLTQAIGSWAPLIVLTLISLTLCTLIKWFLTTEVGFLLQAVGNSPQMLINVGKSTHYYLTLGLVLSNGCAALAGALFVQYTGYFSIWASVGVLIIGLAGMILAQALSQSFGIALLIGAILYQAIIAATFELQLNQDWNKLITAVLIVLLILLKQWLYAHKEEV
jgi:putative ABC transport system permease protein